MNTLLAASSTISFPGLGIGEFTVSPEAFRIPGMERGIAWYALIITFGMICCFFYTLVQAKKIGITFDDVIDYALFTIPSGVIGARLYYVIFDGEHVYKTFWDVINITNGGLAIYGGIIAGTIAVLAVSYFKKINFFAFGDCVAPGVLLAQGIGRWGNFMNGEAFGEQTDIFIRMGLKNNLTAYTFGTSEMVYVHPTFLYESLWNLVGVLGVYLFAKLLGKKYDGQLVLLTFGWYGLGRMFIEGLRMDSLTGGSDTVRVSQLLAGVIFVLFLAMLIFFKVKPPKRELYKKAFIEGENKKEPDSFDKMIVKIKSFFAKDNSDSKNDKSDK